MTRPYTQSKLQLDPQLIQRGRGLAQEIVAQITPLLLSHTTVSVERAVLRLLGIQGINPDGIPLPNVVIDHCQNHNLLAEGAARLIAKACLHYNLQPQVLAERLANDELSLENLPAFSEDQIIKTAFTLALPAIHKISQQRQKREDWLSSLPETPEPYLYVIVATGNIYEDVLQVRVAARQGADIIAVIRSTGQSLLDYVPYGPTTEGFGEPLPPKKISG